MPGVLEGIDVLDLSWGVAGPVATMLLSDHGARVTTVEPPGGHPWRDWSGARVWRRGKRSAVLDLRVPADRDASARPAADGRRARRVPPARFGRPPRPRRPRWWRRPTRGSSTARSPGYGRGTPDEDRPAWDALVTARTGMWWEVRGWPGGTPDRLSGHPLRSPEVEVPPGAVCGAERDGPAVHRRAVDEHGDRLPGHPRDQRGAAGARADRPRPARRHLALAGRHRLGAHAAHAGAGHRCARLLVVGRRRPGAEGPLRVRRRPVDPALADGAGLRVAREHGRASWRSPMV